MDLEKKGDEQADGWWKTTDWQRRLGSRWTTANDWTPWEEPMGQIEINSMEGCWIENPRRGGKQKTRTSETSASETSSTSGTSEKDRRRKRTSTPKPSPTPKPTRLPSEDSTTSEWSQNECEFGRKIGRRASARWSGGLHCRRKTKRWSTTWMCQCPRLRRLGRAKEVNQLVPRDQIPYCDKLAKLQRLRCQLLVVEQKAPKSVSWCTSVEEGHNVEASLR